MAHSPLGVKYYAPSMARAQDGSWGRRAELRAQNLQGLDIPTTHCDAYCTACCGGIALCKLTTGCMEGVKEAWSVRRVEGVERTCSTTTI